MEFSRNIFELCAYKWIQIVFISVLSVSYLYYICIIYVYFFVVILKIEIYIIMAHIIVTQVITVCSRFYPSWELKSLMQERLVMANGGTKAIKFFEQLTWIKYENAFWCISLSMCQKLLLKHDDTEQAYNGLSHHNCHLGTFLTFIVPLGSSYMYLIFCFFY